MIDYASMNLSDAQREEMYRGGVWTGILNALDRNSPRAVEMAEEVEYWKGEGIKLVQQWKRKKT